MDESKSALKPCPFCGGEAVVHAYSHDPDISDWYYVFCKKCVCRLEVSTNRNPFYTKMEAIEAWNRRAERTAKVNKVTRVSSVIRTGRCGDCGYDVIDSYKHCPYCGCKLDWSE
ncbi:MAG: Lar family restriction alleviation protein [Anaerolineaceae bacterium]|nr:Lar family restriction alleviation protein [Anaerolineaceae bacterium]